MPLLNRLVMLIPLLVVMVVSMPGCQWRPGHAPRDVAPLFNNQGHARSLVLTSPMIREIQSASSQIEPWYAARRDMGPFVTAGQVSPRRERSVTTTIDRQFIFNGRVYDRYIETTRRQSHRQGTR